MSTQTEHTFTTSGHIQIEIKYNTNIERGQGYFFCKPILEFITKKYPNRVFDNCLDWCSGAGYLGYELYDNDICKQLHLMDSYGPFISKAQDVIKKYNLPGIKTYVCDRLSLLSPKKFDLIIGNPPWTDRSPLKNTNIVRTSEDYNWGTHKEFFYNVKRYMTNNASIVLCEGNKFSTPKTFEPYIENAGLYIDEVYKPVDFPNIYLLEIKNK
jgi:methylase of polypeptide subunit release factors